MTRGRGGNGAEFQNNVDRLMKLLRFAFLNRICVCYVVVFHRAYCIEAKTFFEGRSRNTRKNTAKLLQGLQARITK